jgi:hypothetical protein
MDPHARLTQTDMPAAVALLSAGAGQELLDTVLRPFLSGVFLESELATSRRFLDLVLTSMVRGTPSVPAAGMQAIPEQLRDALPPDTITCGTPVSSVSNGVVRSADGEHRASVVIVATDPHTASTLVPGLAVPQGRDVTTWYFLADTDPLQLTDGSALLVVDGTSKPGPLVNTVVLTHAAPSYASDGRVLVSASALGLRESSEDLADARAHLSRLYGVGTDGWQHVATYPIPYALPAMLPPLTIQQPIELADGLIVAGDHRDTASIQGAMVSGRRAADAALARLGRPSAL